MTRQKATMCACGHTKDSHHVGECVGCTGPACHPQCVLGPERDHPGYLEYRCIDENVTALPFPGEED